MTESVVKYAKMWDKATNAGSIEERIKRNEGWNLYFSHLAKSSDIKHNITDNDITNYLKREGYLTDISSIIDIGCGTGSHSLPLSKYGKVTALDMSETSLGVLQKCAENEGVNNIKTVCSMWENFSTSTKYDLVFSSMCPAICNYEELQKFESLSNKYCAILTVGKGSFSKNRRELRELITPRKLKGLSSEVVYIYNCLYALKKAPNVKTFCLNSVSYKTVDEAKDNFKQYFSIFGFEGKRVDKIICDFVDSKSEDGYIRDETTLNKALITWKVNND